MWDYIKSWLVAMYWGVLFASPFIIMCVIIWVVYDV